MPVLLEIYFKVDILRLDAVSCLSSAFPQQSARVSTHFSGSDYSTLFPAKMAEVQPKQELQLGKQARIRNSRDVFK